MHIRVTDSSPTLRPTFVVELVKDMEGSMCVGARPVTPPSTASLGPATTSRLLHIPGGNRGPSDPLRLLPLDVLLLDDHVVVSGVQVPAEAVRQYNSCYRQR